MNGKRSLVGCFTLNNMDAQVEEVLAVIGDDPTLRRRVVADLKRSGSVEATINNFFEGQLVRNSFKPTKFVGAISTTFSPRALAPDFHPVQLCITFFDFGFGF
jgi:hypothetical protein